MAARCAPFGLVRYSSGGILIRRINTVVEIFATAVVDHNREQFRITCSAELAPGFLSVGIHADPFLRNDPFQFFSKASASFHLMVMVLSQGRSGSDIVLSGRYRIRIRYRGGFAYIVIEISVCTARAY